MLNSKSNPKTKKPGAGALKMLLTISSLAITLGGWGILASDQLQSNTPTQTAFVQSAVTNTQLGLTQLSASPVSAAPRAIARTRSSR
jgi:hypothetical protein